MTDQNLNELLDKIQNEIDKTEPTDEAGRERLQQLKEDVRYLQERSDKNDEADESMLERIKEAIEDFETSQPQLTLMLSHMMTILSNAGI